MQKQGGTISDQTEQKREERKIMKTQIDSETCQLEKGCSCFPPSGSGKPKTDKKNKTIKKTE